MIDVDQIPDAESLFIPELILDSIQRLVERDILETGDARELISYSLTKTADCNPACAEAITGLSTFCERFAVPRRCDP